MDLKLLKAFVGVAEHGTVSKTAEVLNITQPALSRQLRSLEHQTGFDLFERVGRGLVLTSRGAQLLAECQGLLTHADALTERARRLRRGDLQVLRVAAASLTVEALFPNFLKQYTKQIPDVRPVLFDVHAADHLGMLERGDADVSVSVINMLPLDDRHFASRLLPRFQMLAACAPSFPIEAGDVKDIAALAHHPLLVLDPSYATRNVFDAACHLAGFKPTILFEGRSVNTLLAMAEAGHGIAIVPSVLKIDRTRIRAMLVTHRRETLQLAVAVIWDKRRTPSRYADQFADLLAAYIRDSYPPALVVGSPPKRSTPPPGKRRPRRGNVASSLARL